VTDRTLISDATRRTGQNSPSTAERHTFRSWAMMNATEWLPSAALQTVQTNNLSRSYHPSTTRRRLAQNGRTVKRRDTIIHLTTPHGEQRIHVRDHLPLRALLSARRLRSSRRKLSVPCVVPERDRRKDLRGLQRQRWRPLKLEGSDSGWRRATNDRDWTMTTTTSTGHDIPIWCPCYALLRSDTDLYTMLVVPLACQHQCTIELSRFLSPFVIHIFYFFFSSSFPLSYLPI